jgi:hypothetical protein
VSNETASFNRGVEAMRAAVLNDISFLKNEFVPLHASEPRILALLKLMATSVKEHELTDDSPPGG